LKSLIPVTTTALMPGQFEQLADVPPAIEWLANLTNDQTRRAYQNDVSEFSHFLGLRNPEEFRTVTCSHVIAWREELEDRALSPTTIRRKLSALSSLYDKLCEKNTVVGNPVDGVKRPMANGNEGSAPATRCAAGRHFERHPRQGHSGHPALSRHAAGGTVRFAREGYPEQLNQKFSSS
jgi:integrase/recombinase XerD